MVAPAIVGGFILAVLQAIALFGSPAILALPAGFHTITTQLWSLFQYPPKVEVAAAFSMPLLLATALLLLVQKRLLGRRGYAAVGGKGMARQRVPLGWWRYPALAGCFAVMTCAIVLPYGILAKAALSSAWAQPAHVGQRHPRQLRVHVRLHLDPGGHRQHAGARRDDGVRRARSSPRCWPT